LASRYGLEIRAATPADALGLAELLATAGATTAPRTLPERLEALRAEPGVVLLASEWGPPSGVVAAHWRGSLLADGPTAWVTLLLVAPDDRRRGIGRLLLKAAAQAARTAGCVTLELSAAPDQTSLRAFCDASGFNPAGVTLTRPLRKGA